jgi:hypothetical protein
MASISWSTGARSGHKEVRRDPYGRQDSASGRSFRSATNPRLFWAQGVSSPHRGCRCASGAGDCEEPVGPGQQRKPVNFWLRICESVMRSRSAVNQFRGNARNSTSSRHHHQSEPARPGHGAGQPLGHRHRPVSGRRFPAGQRTERAAARNSRQHPGYTWGVRDVPFLTALARRESHAVAGQAMARGRRARRLQRTIRRPPPFESRRHRRSGAAGPGSSFR